jgi:hypothetical protein
MKKIRSIMLVAILLLSAMVVFAGTAASCTDKGIRFYGYITDADGNGIEDANVEIERWTWRYSKGWHWLSMGSNVFTDNTGYYETPYKWVWGKGHYQMKVDGNVVGEKDLTCQDFDRDGCLRWSHRWDYQIPEFATIAIPIIAILGLVAFYRRKQKK